MDNSIFFNDKCQCSNLPIELYIDYMFEPINHTDHNTCLGTVISQWYETVYNKSYKRELAKYLKDTYNISEFEISENDLRFSSGFVYGNRYDDDYLGDGAIVRQHLAHCVNEGIVLKREFDYELGMPFIRDIVLSRKQELYTKAEFFKAKQYIKLNTLDDVKRFMVLYNVPVIMVINKYTNFDHTGKDGIVPIADGILKGKHVVLVNGWNKNKIRFLNNYGVDWGDRGHGYLNDTDNNLIAELWGLIPSDHILEPNYDVELWSVRIFSSLYKQRTIGALNDLVSKLLTEEQKKYLGINEDYISGEIIKEGDLYKLEVGSFSNKTHAYRLIDILRTIGYKDININIREPLI